MAQQFINSGTVAGDGSGTPARVAGQIINANFEELYSRYVTLNGQLFGFRKAPGNTANTYEVGDTIYHGYWDANDYIRKSVFAGGDENVRASWVDEDLSSGANGLSAYQIWLNNGNSGSETTFLNSLKGSDGADGAQGETGADGSDGADGTPGGPAGPAGNDGLSAYEIWVNAGNAGTINDYLASLKGDDAVPLGSIEVDDKTVTIKDADDNVIGSVDVLPDVLKIDSPYDCTGKWVIGSHPNINVGDDFIGLSNAITPTQESHIDKYLTSS